MEWLLEIALIGLLSATLFHALRLERALGILKRDRAVLEELVSTFNTSTRLAEQGIENLRTTADGAGRHLSQQIRSGTVMKEDLLLLAERGDKLADHLEKLVKAARVAVQESAADHTMPPFGIAVPEGDMRESAVMMPPSRPRGIAGANVQPRLRSQSERDLLRALRMVR